MKKVSINAGLIIVFLSFIFLQSCSLADLRTAQLEKTPSTDHSKSKGEALLEEAWKAQGLDKLAKYETYEVVMVDHWKGLLGSMGLIWPDNNKKMKFRYVVGTFDSQVEFLEGKSKGKKAGQQSWNYYEINENGEVEFKEKPDKRISFGLAAFQYFFELADRLKRAPIAVYAGEKEFNGEQYDQILVSWETIEPHKEHDQYRLWINKTTKLIDYAEYTIRDNYLPAAANFYGSIHFSDLRDIEGIKIPFKQSIFLNEPSKKDKKYVHQVTVETFEFDTFKKEALYLNPELEFIGDNKVTASK